MQSKIIAASFCGLTVLAAAAPPAAAQQAGDFPAALDEVNLRTWLASHTNLPAATVVSIGSNSIIGLRSMVSDPVGPGRFHVQIRAEVVNRQTAVQGGYLSWSADIDVDCTQRRSRAMGITNYPARDLKGAPRVVGGPGADWVSPTIGTQLYSLISAVCDDSFQRPLAPQVAAAPLPAPASVPPRSPAPRPPAAVVAQAPRRPAPQPASAPEPTVIATAPPAPRPASAPAVVAEAPTPPPAKPGKEPPKVQVAVAAAPPPPSPAAVPAPTFAPEPAPRPRPAPATFSKAAVQVAAAETEAQAKEAIAHVRHVSEEAAALPTSLVKVSVNGRTLYRALFYKFPVKADAVAMCERLKAKRVTCFVRDGYGADTAH
ncbi:SPOR domain-containing protein [Phenylobacterium sp.]|uniref:SPOR domain-containing protein n=1 Tax=Phenylobacterium sp. TaxID=1871053 RepID=UPI002F3E6C9B